MVRTIDARTSQNASYAGSLSIPVTSTPELVGQIGLQTAGIGAQPRVQLEGTVSVDLEVPLPPALLDSDLTVPSVTIQIVRGSTATDPLVYSAKEDLFLGIATDTQVVTVVASDYLPPLPTDGQLVYTMFISTTFAEIGTQIVRVGPESFNGTLYSE